jgi:hypothetical protein
MSKELACCINPQSGGIRRSARIPRTERIKKKTYKGNYRKDILALRK